MAGANGSRGYCEIDVAELHRLDPKSFLGEKPGHTLCTQPFLIRRRVPGLNGDPVLSLFPHRGCGLGTNWGSGWEASAGLLRLFGVPIEQKKSRAQIFHSG